MRKTLNLHLLCYVTYLLYSAYLHTLCGALSLGMKVVLELWHPRRLYTRFLK